MVALDRELERSAEALEGYRRQMHCHLGDFREYWRLREKATSVREEARKGRERTRSDSVRAALSALRPGDVIFVPRAKRRGLAVVLSVREEADGARAGPEVLPPVGARLRGRARRPDEGAVAQIGRCSQRAIPP